MPDTIRVGDAFTRTITATVDDALAMVVPPIGVDSIPGLAIYGDPPVVDDQGGERGEQIVGTRTEAITFVALEEGEYQVPGVELQWWDVNTSRLRTAAVAPVSFVVLPALTEVAFELAVDSAEVEAVATDEASRVDLVGLLRRFGLWLLGFAVVAWIVSRVWRRHGARWMAEWQAAKLAKAESDETYFDKFREVCSAGDPRAALSALLAWYDRARRPSDSAALTGWIAAAGDQELAKAYKALLAAGYSHRAAQAEWDSAALVASVAHARKRMATRARHRPSASLPPLNPTAS